MPVENIVVYLPQKLIENGPDIRMENQIELVPVKFLYVIILSIALLNN
jgi:hypothetical protein